MKTKISIVVVIALLVALSLYTLLRPRFPNRCPYGHTDLIKESQNVSFQGKQSTWAKMRLKYIDPPRDYMRCKKCGWKIHLDGQSIRFSKDPSSFIPPFPSFSTFNYPGMSFTYARAQIHNDIIYDHVNIEGSFSNDAENHILNHLGKHGFKYFTNTFYKNMPVIEATHEGYTVRITYTQTTDFRRFRYIYIVYPGKNLDRIRD